MALLLLMSVDPTLFSVGSAVHLERGVGGCALARPQATA
jgi:hypothetical protein